MIPFTIDIDEQNLFRFNAQYGYEWWSTQSICIFKPMHDNTRNLLTCIMPKELCKIVNSYIPDLCFVHCHFAPYTINIVSQTEDFNANIVLNYNKVTHKFSGMSIHNLSYYSLSPHILSYCMFKLYGIRNFMSNTLQVYDNDIFKMEANNIDHNISHINTISLYHEAWILKLFYDMLIS